MAQNWMTGMQSGARAGTAAFGQGMQGAQQMYSHGLRERQFQDSQDRYADQMRTNALNQQYQGLLNAGTSIYEQDPVAGREMMDKAISGYADLGNTYMGNGNYLPNSNGVPQYKGAGDPLMMKQQRHSYALGSVMDDYMSGALNETNPQLYGMIAAQHGANLFNGNGFGIGNNFGGLTQQIQDSPQYRRYKYGWQYGVSGVPVSSQTPAATNYFGSYR